MEAANGHVPVPGSERKPLPGARAVGATNPEERVEVTVVLRSHSVTPMATILEAMGSQLPQARQVVSRADFEAANSADPQDIAKVEDFAHAHNLDIVQISAPRRSIVLSGTVADLNTAFGVQLTDYTHAGGTYRGRTGSVHVPPELVPLVEGVFGLDDRPQAQPHFRLLESHAQAAVQPHASGNIAYTPNQIAQLYDFPAGVTGQGQTVAIIELGGGYRVKDLNTYFSQLGITSPKVVAVSVDKAHNKPTGTANGPDGEVMLDIEVVGAIAPAAHIVVYFAPNTDRGFLDAITTAIHDNVHKPSVISISWGGPEASWTAQALQTFDAAFQSAATLGVTVCCASGDNGSSDGLTDNLAHVDFPASSPYVLACGGTQLSGTGNTISSEVVWNDGANGGATGGGVSDVFPLPTWQNAAHVPPSVNPGNKVGRGVPDVAGDADPASGYKVQVDGQQAVFGGTSAVAPLWAALTALINQQLGKPVGYLNPLLYGNLAGQGVCHDITSGNNGAYSAAAGWDACTGLGSPDGAKLLKALGGK